MLRNYLLVAVRALRKSVIHSLITVFSLAIGIAASVAIFLFIQDELAFDDFPDRARIYRLNEIQSFEGTNTQHVALSMPGMGPAMLADYPAQIKSYTRFWTWGSQLLRNDETKLIVEDVVRVDSSFFDIFKYPVLAGDPSTFLDEPNTIVLREHIATALFGESESALNQSVRIQDREFKVTGILPAAMPNSHLQFNALVSLNTLLTENPEFNDRWGSNFLNTYLVLDPAADISELEKSFPDFLVRHMENEDINEAYQLYLQQLSDVHLQSMHVEHDYNNYRKFNGAYIDIFGIIAIVILIIAAVNFMNLSIARAGFRWKEVGVRKSIGAFRKQLFIQFMIESMLLCFTALIIGLLLLAVFLPIIAGTIGREISIFHLFSHPSALVWIFAGTMLLAMLSGLYPSMYIASLSATSVLKNGMKHTSKPLFRNVLIITQYAMAVAMIIGTIVVVQQLMFMKNKDVGFSTDQMMLVSMNGEVNEKYVTLKNELLKSPFVEGVTATGQRLGNNFHQWGFKVRTDTAVIGLTTSNVNVDIDFLDVYGIELMQGRGFSREYGTDTDMAFVINEKLAEEVGLESPVGMRAGHGWYHEDSLGSIIGVTRNFNFNSLHFDVNTLAMVVHPDWGFEEMTVKLKADNLASGIDDVRRIYDSVISDWPFTYSFLDEHFEQIYRSDQQMSRVVTIMAGLAIFIACMGLYGLAKLESQRRTKEVGIRKVMGASEGQIMTLLSRNFALLVLIGFVIAVPVTYLTLSNWLEGFAFRVDLAWWIFPLAGIAAIFIAIATISVHAWRSARTNPVSSLRYE